MKQIIKKFGEKLRKRGIEVNASVKFGNTTITTPKVVEERKIIKPIYFESEGK